MKLCVRKDIFDSICDSLGIEKAGKPIHTRSGNYVKVADNPARWEYKPLTINPKEGENARRIRLANKVQTIPMNKDNQILMSVDATNCVSEGKKYIKLLNSELSKKDYFCHVNGKKISYFSDHIYKKPHKIDNLIDRTKVLPYALDIITNKKYGTKGKFTEDHRGDYQEIVGKAEIKDKKGKFIKVGIAVVVADIGKNAVEVKGISIFVVRSRLIKSIHTDALTGNQHFISGDL